MEKLTIVSLTYNHKKFIGQALDSFLEQRTNFAFKILISDDASTDGTTEILKKYAQKYPEKIEVIFRETNLGVERNYLDTLSRAKTQYVSYCEGDDYFNYKYKLQKQVDFLEANPECSMCFHPGRIIKEGQEGSEGIFPSASKAPFTLEKLVENNFCLTSSVMYRWRFVEESLEDIFPKGILPLDWFLHLLHAERGNVGFLETVMSVYRLHEGGVFGLHAFKNTNWNRKNGISCMRFYEELEKRYKVDKSSEILDIAQLYILSCLEIKEMDKIHEFSKEYPEYYKEILLAINDKSAKNNEKL